MVSDLLSASSLILGVLGLLYSTWYPSLSEALTFKIPDHFSDRTAAIKKLRVVFWGKALPLAVSSALTFLILLPDALTIARVSLIHYKQGLEATFGSYDAVKTLFAFLVAGLLALSGHLAVLFWRLRGRLRTAKRKSDVQR